MDEWKQGLLRLPGRHEEAEWLKNRLEMLSVREEIILSAAIQRQPPRTAADMINHILSIPYHEICADTDSHATLGEFFLDHENTTELPPEAIFFIDKDALGKKYEDLHPGLFIGNCYVEYPSTETKLPQYDGIHLPTEDYCWSLRLKLASAIKPEGVWLCLPDYDDISEDRPGDIKIAFQELKVKYNSECTLLDARCVLPGITGLMEYDELADLIYDGQNLGILLDEQGQGQPHFMEQFLSALEWEGCDSLKAALDIAQNLRCYDFVLESELESYGRDALHQAEGTILDDCIDYEGYARRMLEQKGFQSVLDDKAYIARNEQTFVSDYEQPAPEMTMQ